MIRNPIPQPNNKVRKPGPTHGRNRSNEFPVQLQAVRLADYFRVRHIGGEEFQGPPRAIVIIAGEKFCCALTCHSYQPAAILASPPPPAPTPALAAPPKMLLIPPVNIFAPMPAAPDTALIANCFKKLGCFGLIK